MSTKQKSQTGRLARKLKCKNDGHFHFRAWTRRTENVAKKAWDGLLGGGRSVPFLGPPSPHALASLAGWQAGWHTRPKAQGSRSVGRFLIFGSGSNLPIVPTHLLSTVCESKPSSSVRRAPPPSSPCILLSSFLLLPITRYTLKK